MGINITYPKHNHLSNQKILTVNLSNVVLNQDDINLLDRGLSYIPTFNSLSIFKFYDAQNRLIRNLKLKDYFSKNAHETSVRNTNETSVRNKPREKFIAPSSWSPPDHHVNDVTLQTVQQIIHHTEQVLSTSKVNRMNNTVLVNSSTKNNLSNLERRSLNNLINNDSIIIKPADKGGATVILNRESYLKEAYRQLNDTKYYMKLDRPIYKDNITKLNRVLDNMYKKNLITRNQFNFLQAKESDSNRVFYLLPKIHKPLDSWTDKNTPPGRPIVSDCKSESSRISKFIDSYTRPISLDHFAYIKDTYDFISKIRDKIVPVNCYLITADVTSLYTNMCIDRTLQVTRDALCTRGKHNKKLNDYLLELLEITLRNNDFEFNGEYFLQTRGTAMGRSYAPGLADLYMQEIDNSACEGTYKILISLYFRFLDDIFSIWTGTLVELSNFETYLNSLIPGIHITFNASMESINFLDTTIYKKTISETEAVLQTKIYFKETDTHQLLHKLSFHPRHTFKGILKSQLLRFKRISSTFFDYNNACQILFESLTKRNYSKSLLRKMKRDIWQDQSNIIRAPPTDKRASIPIVIPYCDKSNSLVRQWKNFISSNPSFSQTKLITAFSNNTNLRKKLVSSTIINRHDVLVSSKHITDSRGNITRTTTSKTTGMFKCMDKHCKACQYINVGKQFTSTHNKRKFVIHGHFTCKSNNLVYLITCKKCQLQYVGQTGRRLSERISDHISNIKLKNLKPIALHFNLSDHSKSDFSITAIDQLPTRLNSLDLRLLKESTWQNLLQTAFPKGINNLKQQYINC